MVGVFCLKEIYMRVAVIGSRNFSDYELVKKVLDQLDFTILVSGGARGADSLGERYAKENHIETLIFIPEWDKLGKSAGYIRNISIVENSDIIIAFWDGISKGTKHSIDLATKRMKALRIIKI